MNQARYNYLKEKGIVNGCGAKGGFNFSKVIKHNIILLPEFKREKFAKLLEDIEFNICGPHDVRFYNGGFILAFFYANLIFSIDMFKILHWTSIGNRLGIAILCFIGLMIGGIGAFYWCLPWNKKYVQLDTAIKKKIKTSKKITSKYK